MTHNKTVPDTSVIISGIIVDLVKKGEITGEIIIPEFVIEEMRGQASRGLEIGFQGLNSLKELRKLHDEKKIIITKAGRRQTFEEIKLAKFGRIDALIIDIAMENKAKLYTSDMVQALVAEVEGVEVAYYKPYEIRGEISVEKMLTKDTMSLHLKQGTKPYAKRGKPGEIKIVYVKDEVLSDKDMEGIIREILDSVRYERNGSIEMAGHGATVVQLRDMRIAITRPPLTTAIEITIVRPTIKLTLDEYKLSAKLKERLVQRVEGLLIAGPPGSGKSTFAASIAEFLLKEKSATIKTLESPRDLQVPPEITQYGPMGGSFAKTADILLLVRPDYTIYDEVRKTSDFQTFTDLRLAGIGMVGVVHASAPIDAVQRFMSRQELGMIPHIIDTIIFIRGGQIEKVYELSMLVRVPTGMTEADLARPLVEVRNFETGALEYEIYSYGEENVVIPISGEQKKSPIKRLAEYTIKAEVARFDRYADVDIVSDNKVVIYVDNDVMAKIIGKEGRNIKDLETRLGISIDVLPHVPTMGKEVQCEVSESGAYIIFKFDRNLVGKTANFYILDRLLFSATVGKKEQVRLEKNSDVGKDAMAALAKGRLKVFV